MTIPSASALRAEVSRLEDELRRTEHLRQLQWAELAIARREILHLERLLLKIEWTVDGGRLNEIVMCPFCLACRDGDDITRDTYPPDHHKPTCTAFSAPGVVRTTSLEAE